MCVSLVGRHQCLPPPRWLWMRFKPCWDCFVCFVCLFRWRRGKSRTWKRSTSSWWRTRRWRCPTPSWSSSPPEEMPSDPATTSIHGSDFLWHARPKSHGDGQSSCWRWCTSNHHGNLSATSSQIKVNPGVGVGGNGVFTYSTHWVDCTSSWWCTSQVMAGDRTGVNAPLHVFCTPIHMNKLMMCLVWSGANTSFYANFRSKRLILFLVRTTAVELPVCKNGRQGFSLPLFLNWVQNLQRRIFTSWLLWRYYWCNKLHTC